MVCHTCFAVSAWDKAVADAAMELKVSSSEGVELRGKTRGISCAHVVDCGGLPCISVLDGTMK